MASLLLISLYDEYCLGVRQLVANLRQEGHEAALLCLKKYQRRVFRPDEETDPAWQMTLHPDGMRELLAFPTPLEAREWELLDGLLLRLKPDVVGFSVYTHSLARNLEVTRHVRQVLPGALIAWGGPHATLDPEGTAEAADLAFVGEADLALNDLARRIDRHLPIHETPSVAYRTPAGQTVRNPLAPLVADLDSLPFACFSKRGVYYLEGDTLSEGVPFEGSLLHQSHKLMTSRGCPFACSYCLQSYLKEVLPEAARVRFRSVGHVIAELEAVKRERGQFCLEIFDDIFTLRKERLEAFFKEYRERIDMPLWCYTHPQYATPENMNLLKENRVLYVVMGIEAGSERVANDVFHRRTRMERVVEAARNIRAAGLRAFYDLISNNPFETEEDRTETFHLLRRLAKPYGLQLGRLNFYPHVALDRMRREQGLPAAVDFQQYRFWNALYYIASIVDLSDEDARYYLETPLFREEPERLERLADQLVRLGRETADERNWHQCLERDLALQTASRARLEQELRDIRQRKGFRAFLALSGLLRRIKRRLVDRPPEK